MGAWQWTGTGRPLTLNQVPVPTPAADEVLIRVRAAGMCHSDVGELDEPSWAVNIKRNPITLGHEIAGEIAQVGTAVGQWQVGDRVGVHILSARPSRATAATAGTPRTPLLLPPTWSRCPKASRSTWPPPARTQA